MHKNQQGMLRADALGAEMEGICRDEGRAVFVPGLLPGEEARVRIVKEQKRFAFGRLMAPPVQPSPDRRPPDCDAYPRCGGCTCRHMRYEATLEQKRRQVADCLPCWAWSALSPIATKRPCPSAAPPLSRWRDFTRLAATR